MCKSLTLSFLMLMMVSTAFSQDITIDNTYTPQQLAETIMDVNCEVQISNATITGYNGVNGKSYGQYIYNFEVMEDWPLQNGIILGSGYDLQIGMGAWAWDFVSTGNTSWPGDPDITNALGGTTSYNATVLEFDFLPSVDYISFIFAMGSGEFDAYFVDDTRDCAYNDGIAILVKPADNSQPYQNLALIPATTIPISNGNLFFNTIPCWENVFNYNALYNNGYGLVTAGIAVTPGILYHIKIGVTDGLDPDFDSTIMIGAVNPDYSIDLGFDRLHEFFDPLCENEVLTVNSKPGAVQYKWYKDDVLIPGETTAAYTITQPGTYTSVATMPNGCDYAGEIVIEYNAPISQDTRIYYQCDEDGDGLSAYYITQVGIQVLSPDLQPIYYYETLADVANNTPMVLSAQPVPFYNTVPDQLIYVKAQNMYGCQVMLPIQLSTSPLQNITLAPLAGCIPQGDNESYGAFDFTQAAVTVTQGLPPDVTAQFYATAADALAGAPRLPQIYTNSVAGGEIIYVKLMSAQGCYGIVPLQLTVQDFGPGLADEALALCDGAALTLDAGNGFTAYAWQTTPVQTTQSITVDEPGEYAVTVTNNAGCTRTKIVIVFESEAPQSASFEINDFTGGNNTVTVSAVGSGTYEYSLDGNTYQDDTVFNNLPAGEYTLYIRDKNGCGLYTDTFFILDYPTFFTPDDDGLHDTWRIPFMQQRPGIMVSVYDRYGKIITTFSGISAGWDGTQHGQRLPATDYWFSLNLETGRVVKGHFSLIR